MDASTLHDCLRAEALGESAVHRACKFCDVTPPWSVDQLTVRLDLFGQRLSTVDEADQALVCSLIVWMRALCNERNARTQVRRGAHSFRR